MTSTYKGWLIGEYTGDSHKDDKTTYGTAALASNYGTITVDGAIKSALAVGTTNTGSSGVRCTSTTAQLTAGSAIFAGDAATDTIHYWIVSNGP